MHSLATLSKRVTALETAIRPVAVRLECLQVVNLLASTDPTVKAAARQLLTYLYELHAGGICPASCCCPADVTGRRFCAVRSSTLPVLVYCGPAGTISAECALGTFETNVAVPDGKRCEHGSMI